MSLTVKTNIQSLQAQRRFHAITDRVKDASGRLASGRRINRAADDAAGYAIAGMVAGDVRSLGMARRNAVDGISMIQVTEGGLTEISNVLTRLKELSVQAASDTIGVKERGYLDQEFGQMKSEIDRIAKSTEFNGTRLLTGKSDLHKELLANHAESPLEVQVGKDYFESVDSLSSANPVDIIRLNLNNMNAMTSGENSLNLGTDGSGLSLHSKRNAQLAVASMEGAMVRVARYRSDLGALQSRLQKTDRNLSLQMTGLTQARSRIEDADYASESAKLTQNSILQKAAASVLVQANSQSQVAVDLLK